LDFEPGVVELSESSLSFLGLVVGEAGEIRSRLSSQAQSRLSMQEQSRLTIPLLTIRQLAEGCESVESVLFVWEGNMVCFAELVPLSVLSQESRQIVVLTTCYMAGILPYHLRFERGLSILAQALVQTVVPMNESELVVDCF
jgi:hypothetical protein